MLYDGDCPLCMKEVNFLKSRDAGKGKIDFVDIASPSYTAEGNYGITYEQVRQRCSQGLSQSLRVYAEPYTLNLNLVCWYAGAQVARVQRCGVAPASVCWPERLRGARDKCRGAAVAVAVAVSEQQ
jgi:hypothetical protein